MVSRCIFCPYASACILSFGQRLTDGNLSAPCSIPVIGEAIAVDTHIKIAVYEICGKTLDFRFFLYGQRQFYRISPIFKDMPELTDFIYIK